MEDVKSLVATETQKCLEGIRDLLSRSDNGSGNQGQWGQGQGYHSQRDRRQPKGVKGVEEDIIGLDLTTQHFNVITVTR